MDNEAQILLDDAIAFCERDGVETRIVQMLRQSKPLSLVDTRLTVEAPSRFAYSFIVRQKSLIESYLEQIAFVPMELDVVPPEAPESPAPRQAREVASPPQPQPEAGTAEDAAGAGGPVTNSVSREGFERLMAQMSGEPMPAQATATQSAETTAPEAPRAVPIDSKYTFETFVCGNENKLALNSAQRFCAFAEEPGAYDILFIYGHSGVGKTHLLLAIKNYLMDRKSGLRVKYANSQNYLDDYIGEVALGHAGGRRILPEYHDANILIIDDIQNIIGKQQSVEHFFTLMDEFIRERKKIAIASDRAPKELAMDERLTSRFNSGMLCPIAEPGFEMKYAILKRYYENTLMPMGTASYANVDRDLLEGLSIDCGKLTDEHLRFMAENSGDNIRELESFCERCAHESLEREQAGEEFTGDDIRRIADQYFDTAEKVIRVETVQRVVEEFYHVSHTDLLSHAKKQEIAFARHMAVYLTGELCQGLGPSAIGAAFNRNHSTVISSIRVIEKKKREDPQVLEEYKQLRDKIRLKS